MNLYLTPAIFGGSPHIQQNTHTFSNAADDRFWYRAHHSACNVGDWGSIPGLGRSSGEGNGNPLQDSCLENPMDRGAWKAIVHGVAKSQTQLSDCHTHVHTTLTSEHKRDN